MQLKFPKIWRFIDGFLFGSLWNNRTKTCNQIFLGGVEIRRKKNVKKLENMWQADKEIRNGTIVQLVSVWEIGH